MQGDTLVVQSFFDSEVACGEDEEDRSKIDEKKNKEEKGEKEAAKPKSYLLKREAANLPARVKSVTSAAKAPNYFTRKKHKGKPPINKATESRDCLK